MVILITGITSGFGKAMAEQLSLDGHKVYGTYRKGTDRIPGVSYLYADASDEESVRKAVGEVVNAEGEIDVFINNAGMGVGGPLELTPVADAELQMDVNFMGMVRFLHYVLPVMREQRHGRIICFSSIGGLMGLPFQGLYSASKYAIEGYCEALRLEVRCFGIDVVVINPGDFSTSFTAKRRKVDPEAGRLYPQYAAAMASIEHDETNGLTPDFLAGKISRIVKIRKPAHRYIISTFEQRLSVIVKALVPGRVYDRILSSYYHM